MPPFKASEPSSQGAVVAFSEHQAAGITSCFCCASTTQYCLTAVAALRVQGTGGGYAMGSGQQDGDAQSGFGGFDACCVAPSCLAPPCPCLLGFRSSIAVKLRNSCRSRLKAAGGRWMWRC